MPKKSNRIKLTDQKKPWNRRFKEKNIRSSDKVVKKLFLIICEGVNTEPAYFESFPLGNADVESYGTGSSKTALVKEVLKIIEFDEDAKSKEIWIVFNFDINPSQVEQQKEDYNNAIKLATKNGLKVACSNDAFELWLLLHYQLLDMQWTRHQYYEKLSELWNCNYVKQGKILNFCQQIYKRLEEDERASQEEAIKRSKCLHLKGEENGETYAERNPHTTIYQLVEELNVYL